MESIVSTRFEEIRMPGEEHFLFAVAIWPVTGQGFQNTKWPAVLYSQ